MPDTPEIAAIREYLAVLAHHRSVVTDFLDGHRIISETPSQVDVSRDRLRSLLAAHDARESAPSVDVRIAVAVAPDGRWSATGWSEAEGDDEIADAASEGLDALVGSVHFVVARVPLPVSTEIEGRVEQ